MPCFAAILHFQAGLLSAGPSPKSPRLKTLTSPFRCSLSLRGLPRALAHSPSRRLTTVQHQRFLKQPAPIYLPRRYGVQAQRHGAVASAAGAADCAQRPGGLRLECGHCHIFGSVHFRRERATERHDAAAVRQAAEVQQPLRGLGAQLRQGVQHHRGWPGSCGRVPPGRRGVRTQVPEGCGAHLRRCDREDTGM